MLYYYLGKCNTYSVDYTAREWFVIWCEETKRLRFFAPVVSVYFADVKDIETAFARTETTDSFVRFVDYSNSLNVYEDKLPFKFTGGIASKIVIKDITGVKFDNLPTGLKLYYKTMQLRITSTRSNSGYNTAIISYTGKKFCGVHFEDIFIGDKAFFERNITDLMQVQASLGVPLYLDDMTVNMEAFQYLLSKGIGFDCSCVDAHGLTTLKITGNLGHVPCCVVDFIDPSHASYARQMVKFNIIDLSECKGLLRKYKGAYHNLFFPMIDKRHFSTRGVVIVLPSENKISDSQYYHILLDDLLVMQPLHFISCTQQNITYRQAMSQVLSKLMLNGYEGTMGNVPIVVIVVPNSCRK